MTVTVYVGADVSADGNFADCTYYRDHEGDEPIEGSEIHIPMTAGAFTFEQSLKGSLSLIGATFKTLGTAAGMNASNFAPANDDGQVTFAMPTNTVITKGVVLLFSTPGVVENLYPSSDPQVINDASACP